MWTERERKHEINKGKSCKEPGCNFAARAKGYCSHCYVKIQKSRMTYAESGVNIKKEEKAIQIMMKDMSEDGRRGIIRFGKVVAWVSTKK